MTWNLLLGILVLASAVASLPLDNGSYKNASNYNKENVLPSSSESDEDSSSSDEEIIEDEGTDGGEEQQPKFCTEPASFTIVYTV